MNSPARNPSEIDDAPADITADDLALFRQLEADVLAGEEDEPDLEEELEQDEFEDDLEEELEQDELEYDPDAEAEIDPLRESQIEEQLHAVADIDPLDVLWREVSAGDHKRKRPERDLTKAIDAASRRLHALYTNPENWERIRGVTLMHKDSQTLLGNFSEFRHRIDHKSTKLLRDTALVPVEAILEVEGTWWLEPLAREHIEAAAHWQTQRSVVVRCLLDRLGVFCPAAPLTLFLQFGGIMRVELSEPCMFASADGSIVMHLARGVNVYECMDHEGKVALRQEIVL